MNAFCLPAPDDEFFPLALRAARGDRPLADEALQHLRVQFWRALYDSARGPFRAWAATVLRRYCFDVRRARFRTVGGPSAPESATPSRLPALEFGLDLSAPFCRDDLAAVRGWKPRLQLVLLGWHGLWDKLPPPDRDRALAAVRPAVPFPVADFFDWPEKDRTRYLARALRCPPNTVARIRLRGLNRLAALRFVREVRGV